MSGELGIKGFDTGGLSDAQIADFETRVGDNARRVASELQALRVSSCVLGCAAAC
jgi:hypothetical protein